MSSEKKTTLESSDGETFELEERELQTIKHIVEDDSAAPAAVDDHLNIWDSDFFNVEQFTLFTVILLEKLQVIETDQNEYTLDVEDQKVQQVILKPDPCSNDTVILKKSLSCSYPKCSFDKALKKENEKLLMELQRSQTNLDVAQCERLIEDYPSFSSKRDLHPSHGSYKHQAWNTDLLDCCSEPCLCLKTCFYPCGTISKISTVVNNRLVSSAAACNDLAAYSLILSCFCYTCSVRGKLRKMLGINGGMCDDFLSHLMCCCCALVQEWREVEIRDAYGHEKTKNKPPPPQFMES